MTLSKKYLDEFSKYVIMEPYPFVVDIQKSKGMYLATVDGDMIFDWAGYYGAKLISHNHDGLFEKEYLNKLIYAANNKIANPDFLTPECTEYYRKLYELAPKCMKNPKMEIYAVNSGAEAIENLSKYFINLYDKKRTQQGKPIGIRRLIYFEKSFHGRTIFTLNITQLPHAPVITKDFEGLILGNIQVPFPEINNSKSKETNDEMTRNCLQKFEEILIQYSDDVVGVIVEPIQGAGGHRVADKYFFQQLSKLCYKYDVSLGFDEVQTAGGQTGEMFMADSFDLPFPPQAIATGKKFANGVIYMYNTMEDFGILDSTWGGNLADMVRFVQEMKIIERENLINQVPEKTKHLVNGLENLETKYPKTMFNVRGRGLYQGFSLFEPQKRASFIDFALNNEKMLLLEAGTDTIRFRPVIDVTIQDIDLMLVKLENCLKHIL